MSRRLARGLWFIASLGLHVVGLWASGVVWILLLVFMILDVFTGEHPFAFRWDNPFFKGSRTKESIEGEDVDVVLVPRRRRPLPVMEKPRDLDLFRWNSRTLPLDPGLGPPGMLLGGLPAATPSGFMQATGDSIDFVSDKAFRGKGTYDILGSGGGGGGRYGSRVIRRDIVQTGLLWLARHQDEDGAWREGSGRCGRALPDGRVVAGACEAGAEGRDDIVLTSLALLAFDGGGYSRASPDLWDGLSYRDVLARGVRFLSRVPEAVESRVFALLALTAIGELPEELFDRVIADPSPEKGSSLEAWKALALISAARSGLRPRPARIQEAVDILDGRREPASWPGADLADSYLRLLGSYEVGPTLEVILPRVDDLLPALRAGQVLEAGACGEGSWPPAAGAGRARTTVLHLLALESFPGYSARLDYPLR